MNKPAARAQRPPAPCQARVTAGGGCPGIPARARRLRSRLLTRARPLAPAAAAAGFVVMWSSGFIGARLFRDTAGTFTILMWRLLIPAALLGTWRAAARARQGRGRRTISARQIAAQIVIGLLAQGVYLTGVFIAEALGVPAGTTALVAALQPLLAGALAGTLLGERVTPWQWAGLGAGLAGVLLVVALALPASRGPAWAYALPFASMVALTAATLLQSRAGARIALADALTIQCGASAGLFTIAAIAAGQFTFPRHGEFWLAMAWFLALSTIGGYGFYWLVLRQTSATRVSSLIYLTPPATMLWGFLMFGETVTPLAATGIAVCAAAVWLVLGRRQRSSATSPGSRGGPNLRETAGTSGTDHAGG